MKTITGWQGLAESDRGAVVAIGAFDGVHRGHRAVIDQARREAEARNLPLGVVTFDPHPRRWFQPDAAPFRLMDEDQRARALAALGVDRLYVLDFDATMAGLSDRDFAERVLGPDGLNVRHAVVGFDFTFGRGRTGSPDALARYGAALGFTVETCGRRDDADGLKLSSSAVREALRSGDMARATHILGRPFAIRGEVVHGDKRGRTIQVPTANVALTDYMRPAYGVYATRSRVDGGDWIDGVANLGVRPMFAVETPLLEVWLLDFDGDLYGQMLETQLVARLRGEMALPDLTALKHQIAEDERRAREILAATPIDQPSD